MKLQSFQIKGVKSILDSGLCHLSDKDNVTVFAGQNEAGKSAVLEALDFFSNGANDRFKKLSTRADSDQNPAIVECTFKLENNEKQHDDTEILEVLQDIDEVTFVRDTSNSEPSAELALAQHTQEAIEKAADKRAIKAKPVKKEDSGVEVTQDDIEDPSKEKQATITKVKEYLINCLPDFIYYDSFSDILPGEILITDIPNSKPVLDFQKIFDVDFSTTADLTSQQLSALKTKINNAASVDLNSYWSQTQTTKDDDKYRFEININLDPANTASKVEFLIHRNDGNHLFLEQKSKGFQWFNAFNLRLKALGITKKENLSSYVILIDEPGQGLHEAAQKDVKKVLEEIAGQGAQILYSTHNPSLIGVNDKEILRIRLVFQTREDGSKIKNLAQFATLEGSKEALSPIITAMGAGHIGQILDATKKIVVVEGITDHYYLAAMKQLLKIDDDFVFVPACGASNVKSLIAILLGWRQNFRVVLDGGAMGKSVLTAIKKHLYIDDDGGLKANVKVLDQFDGIEDLFSLDDFKKYVLKDERISYTKKNSEIAKEKKKELLGRMFLSSLEDVVRLNDETVNNFKPIFEWIKNGSA